MISTGDNMISLYPILGFYPEHTSGVECTWKKINLKSIVAE
jgi:hypothetical protein